jgi:hypothetical protein
MHQHARVAIAGHHAVVARFALVRDALQIEHRTQRLVPGLAAPDVEVPVEVKILIAADAGNHLPLAAHIAGDFGERGARVEHLQPLQTPIALVRSEFGTVDRVISRDRPASAAI